MQEEAVFIENTKENVKAAFEKYGRNQVLKFLCENCKKESLKKVKYFKKQNYKFLCTNCGRILNAKETFMKNLGVENPMQLKQSSEKIKKTKKEKYGDENFNNRDKSKKTCKEKLGVENVSQAESIKEKKKKTFEEHFGTDNVFKTEYFDQKRKETNLKKYGFEFAQQSAIVKERCEETNLKKYGFKSSAQNPKVKEKIRKSICETLSTRPPEVWRDIRQKACKKYCFENIYFDSSWELALWIYAKDHDEEIEREPCCFEYEFEEKVHKYFPDFKYKGKLIEIKGDFFFNEEGRLYNPFDRTLDGLFAAKQAFMKSQNILVWSNKEIQPILDYINEKYTKDFLNLFRKDLPFPYPSLLKGDYNTIRFFHKSIFEASYKKRKSPLQAWNDKECVRKSALNRLRYVHRCRPEDILKGFSLTQLAPKVSVFKPSTAETLIKKYLNDFNEIFDPFSGFSGRMIGTARCNKTYNGQDINEKHVNESNEIIEFLKLRNCSVIQQDILNDIEQVHECLFTCPPYGGKEHWNENEIEKTCDEWIDICLQKYKCKKYLFVVDETEKYKDKIVEVLNKKTLFKGKPEIVILIEA